MSFHLPAFLYNTVQTPVMSVSLSCLCCWARRLLMSLFGLGLVLACPPCATGQDAPSSIGPSLNATDDPQGWVPSLRTMGKDAVTIVRAPFTLTPSEQLITLGATGLVASTASVLDDPAHRHLHTRSGAASDFSRPLAGPGRWFDRVGPDRFTVGTAGLLAVGGLALQRTSWTRTSVRLVEALVYTKAVTGLAKSAINRSRPFAGSDPLTADPGGFDSAHEELSMPSGHTARAFALASVLAHQADRWYVSVPAYGLAGSVAAERVRSGDHWLTDVVVGGALGYFIGRTVSDSPSIGDDVSYTPILSTDRVGLSVRF